MTKLTNLAELREKLPYGAQKEIAKRSGYNRMYVNRVLKGLFYNEEIIKTTIEYLKEEKEKLNSLNQTIEELLNEA